MLIIHVHIHVKPEDVEAFSRVTIENARNGIGEPGIVRFEVLQQIDDPKRFLLVQAYRDEDVAVRHQETAHYARWRDMVAELMAEPPTEVRFSNVFPADEGR
ncbi:MAG: antibiotic biosynthesis monooxygenase [Candidatus Aminicenantes bacterium]|nr:antibiotic biosynthesis monooxygenase [Candidatus Aminicenantes bacterium]